MSSTEMKVVAFLSGKGGSGKTTVAISMAKLLSDMGIGCMLIDFDLATNGASYFFKNRFDRDSVGICEELGQGVIGEHTKPPLLADTSSSGASIMDVEDHLAFVPSRVNFGRRTPRHVKQVHDERTLIDRILLPLLGEARTRGLRYVFIDCQAGYSSSSWVAAKCADMAIIVTEADAVSSDAADSLMMQLGEDLPSERRYLVNKVDVRDAQTYRSMHDVFQSMNRLPPLPFDFSVRNAFGARRIPVDLAEPSPLLFALFETTKYAFPEIYDDIQAYRETHIDKLFGEYDARLENLLARKRAIDSRSAALASAAFLDRRARMNVLIYLITSIYVVAAAVVFLMNTYLGRTIRHRMSDFGLPAASLLVFAAAIPLIAFYVYRRRWAAREELSSMRERAKEEGRVIERELDQVRSFLWSRSREYMLDMAVTGEMPHLSGPASSSASDTRRSPRSA